MNEKNDKNMRKKNIIHSPAGHVLGDEVVLKELESSKLAKRVRRVASSLDEYSVKREEENI